MAALLEVKGLETQFRVGKKTITAVGGIDFTVGERETLAIVGESGSGKSVTALSIMRLVPNPPGRVTGGEVVFGGEDLLRKTKAEMRDVRGNQISMIFQEPMTSLNPVYTIGNQLSETFRRHQKLGRKKALERSAEMLDRIGIPAAAERLGSYPHQLSGGMRQRVMIAMALCCNPRLLIADEPTTALDVTIQAQILDLIRQLKERQEMSVLIITHDLGVVAEVAQRVVVMYGGMIMECSGARELFLEPLHPYTRGLLASIPRMGTSRSKPLSTIRGIVPDLSRLPEGCVFSPRCDSCAERCRRERPPMRDMPSGRSVRCWLYEGGGARG
ncbi:MAG: ABC transporter ATP-binding protein [Clostridiales bacterium]|jgi:peptide/nickel transport system ATP-binding protein/oligopeptide transport system ATP-binding protein|nr:ABC transporter ATP-binding protein [Clostridiales bacterium]